MQLFVTAGVPLGTLAVDVLPSNTVRDLKHKLGRRSRRLSNADAMVRAGLGEEGIRSLGGPSRTPALSCPYRPGTGLWPLI